MLARDANSTGNASVTRPGTCSHADGLERAQQRAHLAGGPRVVQAGERLALVAGVVAAEVDGCLGAGLGQHAERQVEQADRPAQVGDRVRP